MNSVPCNGCTACCKSDHIILGPKDDPSAFKWHIENGYAVVDRKPSGECIYLTDSGCSIHDRAPDICKRFDCRVLFMSTPPWRRIERVKENPSMRAVYSAGVDRLGTI